MPRPDQDSRGGRGQYRRTLAGAERDAEAARLFDQGLNYREIGEHLGIHKSQAIRAVQRALRAVVQDAGEAVLRTQINRLEYLYGKAVEIAEADHVVVSHGHIIYGEDGQPLRDHGPVLAALREARAGIESLNRMLGLNKPDKVEHSGTVKYELVGVEPTDVV